MLIQKLVNLLQESMPGVGIKLVELGEGVQDPLREVLKQLDSNEEGPVMIMGLEHAVPSAHSVHRVLHVMNLGRSEWKLIARPVVLWVPEYLLALMGLEAPDFLDWRSDTFFFVEKAAAVELGSLDSGLWRGGTDFRLPERLRLARLDELSSRLAGTSEAEDPVILSARFSWFVESGNHLLFLGNLDEAESMYREGLDLAVRLGMLEGMARCSHQLGMLAQARGDFRHAKKYLEKALRLSQDLALKTGEAATYHELGKVEQALGNLERARSFYQQSLQINAELGRRESVARSLHNLGILLGEEGRIEESLRHLEASLEIKREVDDMAGMAATFHELGRISQAMGDFERARGYIEESLRINQELGQHIDIAKNLGQLGIILTQEGKPAEAVKLISQALQKRVLREAEAATAFGWLNRLRQVLGQEKFLAHLQEAVGKKEADEIAVHLQKRSLDKVTQ